MGKSCEQAAFHVNAFPLSFTIGLDGKAVCSIVCTVPIMKLMSSYLFPFFQIWPRFHGFQFYIAKAYQALCPECFSWYHSRHSAYNAFIVLHLFMQIQKAAALCKAPQDVRLPGRSARVDRRRVAGGAAYAPGGGRSGYAHDGQWGKGFTNEMINKK